MLWDEAIGWRGRAVSVWGANRREGAGAVSCHIWMIATSGIHTQSSLYTVNPLDRSATRCALFHVAAAAQTESKRENRVGANSDRLEREERESESGAPVLAPHVVPSTSPRLSASLRLDRRQASTSQQAYIAVRKQHTEQKAASQTGYHSRPACPTWSLPTFIARALTLHTTTRPPTRQGKRWTESSHHVGLPIQLEPLDLVVGHGSLDLLRLTDAFSTGSTRAGRNEEWIGSFGSLASCCTGTTAAATA